MSHNSNDKQKISPELQKIWVIEDKTNLVAELGFYLSKKCGFGDNIKTLSKEEFIIYVVNSVEGEVNNGGFFQFFSNSSGAVANEAVSCMKAIGAEKTAKICKKALSCVGIRLPKNKAFRNFILDRLPERVADLLAECDDKFYDYEDNLSELCYTFIMNNKENFT